MNVYTFIICTLLASVLDYKMVTGRTTYDSPTYNSDRDENLVNHQKKRLANEESLQEPSEFERGYETNRYRKFDPDAGYIRREETKVQKRDFYDPSSSSKDASIEVILDPRAKKAVAVVENSPSGQAMYDLSGWKNKEEGSSYESDQFAPGTQQEQVVNLVYPAERTERKYATEFGTNTDSKIGFKEKEDTHKRKRNADLKKDSDKRSIQDKKRKSEQKVDSKQNECPPHNTPSTGESENKEKLTSNPEKEVKRDTSQWSSDQLSALRNSLNNVQDTNGEVQNLRNILSSMGLLEDSVEKKRETDTKVNEKRDDTSNSDLKEKEDEDLNQDNLVLKRNNREAKTEELSPEEPIEKRETEDENYEEEMNEEFEDKSNVKRSNTEAEIDEAKEDVNSKDRGKRQEEKLVATDVSQSEAKNEKAKRETGDATKEVRKNRADETEEEYERRMENQIQAKIDAIKEKVKREIMEEQYKRRYKRNQENIPINRKRRQTKDDAKAIKEESHDKSAAIASEAKVVRRKRANLAEKQMVYQGYQGADAEEEAEDNEFDDNAFDGRMYVEKRQAEDESDYYDPVRKREEQNYVPYYPDSRSRRSEDSNAFHGSRRALKNKGFMENQDFNSKSSENEKDSEYFGSLPQGYNGELTRYKRVKRDDPYK